MPVVLVLVAAPAAAAAPDRCHHAGERTLALTGQLRVVVDSGSGYRYACLRRTGRRTLLWEQDDLYIDGKVRLAAGRFVAYTVSTSPGCKADCPPDVHGTWITAVTDARTGHTRELYDGLVSRVLLAPSGTVAWVAGALPDNALSLWRVGGRSTQLATGEVRDMDTAGGVLTWSDGDGDHSTPFA